jgi:hypothetical protein
MSLSLLATVELQLIMQCLDQSSLLLLARCSRFTLHAAASEFAFSRLLPLVVDSADAIQLSTSLLRYRDVELRWRSDSDRSSQAPLSEREPDVLKTIEKIRVLDTRLFWFPADLLSESWTQILSLPRPALQNLRGLIISHQEGELMLCELLLQHVPTLQSLHVAARRWALFPWGFFEGLSRMPQLTELSVANVCAPDQGHLVPELKACTTLRTLKLDRIADSILERLLTVPDWTLIQHLSLTHCDAETDPAYSPSPTYWIAIWKNLCNLISLELNSCRGVRVIIRELILTHPTYES